MADIDRARKIANSIIHLPGSTIGRENLEILADGFLALDEQMRTYSSSEKPEKNVDVLVTMKLGGHVVGHYDGKKLWYAEGDEYFGDKDIKCWRPLIVR